MLFLFQHTFCGSSTKKGFAQDDGRGLYSTRISILNVGWYYTWSNTYPTYGPNGVPWTAMIWSKKSVTDQVIANLTAMGKAGTIKELLGFNEPDNQAQSNMSVDDAIALWPKLMSTGLRLGSQAVA